LLNFASAASNGATPHFGMPKLMRADNSAAGFYPKLGMADFRRSGSVEEITAAAPLKPPRRVCGRDVKRANCTK
jgi:hypothetical protein